MWTYDDADIEFSRLMTLDRPEEAIFVTSKFFQLIGNSSRKNC